MTLKIAEMRRDDLAPAHPVSGVSRRSFLMTSAVSVASLASATAVAAPSVTPPTTSIAADQAISEIGSLMVERASLYRKYRKLRKAANELHAVHQARLPEPHPSIVYNEENAKDGLASTWEHDRDRPINSATIERLIEKMKMRCVDEAWTDAGALVLTVHKQPQPVDLNAEGRAKLARYETRLEHARAYEEACEAIDKELGYFAAEDETESLLDEIGDLDVKIFRTPAASAADLKIKIRVFESDGWECDSDKAKYLLRDVKRMLLS